MCHCQWLFNLTTFQCNAGKVSISIYALIIYKNIRCIYLYTCTWFSVQVTVIILLVITCLNCIFSTAVLVFFHGKMEYNIALRVKVDYLNFAIFPWYMYCILRNIVYVTSCVWSQNLNIPFQCSTGSWGTEFWSRIQGVCREGMPRRGICTREISQESQIYRNCQVNISQINSISQINIISQIKVQSCNNISEIKSVDNVR